MPILLVLSYDSLASHIYYVCLNSENHQAFELWLEKYNKPLYSTNEPSLKYNWPFVSTGSVGRLWQFFISIEVIVPACHMGDWD